MSLRGVTRGGLAGILIRWASRLRFPYLFLLTAALFVLNLFIPDAIPMADELIMGLVAVLLGSLRKRSSDDQDPAQQADTEQ
jgi:hypothetical protein